MEALDKKAGLVCYSGKKPLQKLTPENMRLYPVIRDIVKLIRRINLTDPEERMPYKHDPLSKEDIAILRNWIKQGAKWGEHWAYVPLKEDAIPKSKTFWLITK